MSVTFHNQFHEKDHAVDQHATILVVMVDQHAGGVANDARPPSIISNTKLVHQRH